MAEAELWKGLSFGRWLEEEPVKKTNEEAIVRERI